MTPAPGADSRPLDEVFDHSHYASTVWGKMMRSLELGPKYYWSDIPRYFRHRRSVDLPFWDWAALWNPLRELRQRTYALFPLPPAYQDALLLLRASDIRLVMPRKRLEALTGAWWKTRDVPGDVIECGAYRGATSLLLTLLGKMHNMEKRTFILDAFGEVPSVSEYDVSDHGDEFLISEDQVTVLEQQADALGLRDRIEILSGLFETSFRSLKEKSPTFSFVHIDANMYRGTWEACQFTIPRTSSGGMVVFDDYNGICDLGARLAIDRWFARKNIRPSPLTGSSAYVRVGSKTKT